ncbi:hypothetical protein AB1Y20_023454 [Prymnesium parvum]|uniref:Glycosyl transferase family 25 domain-containing protein n=1 Tax=Prymnesium parvum TaxID=97485 RepID=A0AB34JH26_PRYPA
MFTGEPLHFSPRDAARGADTLPGAAPPKPAVREWNGPPWREESAFEVKGGLSSPYYHASLPKEAPPPLKLSAEQLHAAANAVKETHSALHGPYYYAHNRRVDFVIPTPPPKLLSVAKRVPPPLEDNGGAVLILSPGRRHLWPKPPRALHVVDAVMGACLPSTAVTDLNKHARQELTRGELGILKSNRRAWQYALDKKWDWALVLEDDAVFEGISSKISSSATAEFLTRLPAIVRAATSASPDWQLLVLTPINQPWDFFASLDGSLVPDLISHGGKMRSPLAVAPGQPRYGQHTMRRGGSASSARSAALGLYTDAKGSAARRRLREGTGSESEVLVEAIDCNGAVEWSARGEICHGSLHVDPTPYSSAMLGAVRTDAIEWSNGSVWRRCDLSVPIGSVDGLHVTSISWEDATCSWYHCPPTFHAFGWIYRKDLIKDCVGAFDARAPPLNPLDVWIWEVMATRGKLAQALAPAKPLVNSLGVGNTASCPSVKEQQDRPDTLHRIHARRGHG